ncbi:MAG: hypothetical protein US70_C0036G0008, partial [Parcubacteria group bacterium GW2011_GWD2_38_11]
MKDKKVEFPRVFFCVPLKKNLCFLKKVTISLMLVVFTTTMTSSNLILIGAMQARAQEIAVDALSNSTLELEKSVVKDDPVKVSESEKKNQIEVGAIENDVVDKAVLPEFIKDESSNVTTSAIGEISAEKDSLLEEEIVLENSIEGNIVQEETLSEISDQNLIENLALDGQNQSQLITDHIPTWPAIDPVPATIEREFSTSDQIIKNPNEVPAETWNVDNGKAVTNEKVELGKKYVAPQNDQVSVTFTKLPDNPGTLSIEEIILSNEQMQSLNAVSVVAYDITSSMTNGTFKYELTLPKPESKKKVQIKFAEDVAGLDKANIVRSKDVKVYNNSARTVLDHFTIFVVATYADINLTTLAVSYEQGATVYANATVTNDVNYYEMDIIDPNPNIGITATSGCQTMTPSLNMSYLLASNATISNGWAVFVNEYSSLADCNSRFNPVNTQSVNFAVVVAPVIDLTPPVITILGNNPETVFQNTVYTDAGATALD